MAANALGVPPRQHTNRHPVSDGTLMLLNSFALPAAATAAFAAWMLVFEQALDGPHFLLGVLTFLVAGEINSVESYFVGGARPSRRELAYISWRWAAIVVAAWAGIELAGIGSSLNKRMLTCVALTMPLILWLAQSIVAQWCYRTGSADLHRRSIIVGLTEIGARWEASLAEHDNLNVQVMGFFDDREPCRLPASHRTGLLGKMQDVAAFVRDQGIQIVYITLPISRHPRIMSLLTELRDSTVSIYFVPDVFAFNPVQARIECIHGIPLLAVCESPFAGPAGVAKRAIDIVVSLAALMVLAIPMLILALIIRATSKGPVIFKQQRYGLDGEAIVVFKFRTMTVTEDGDRLYTQVQRGDSRVTPVGAFMRATSLDELPQLFNVLQGSMSVVGPRPHAIAVNEQYRQKIPSYMLRHKVKPGITGLAQVLGFRGGDDLPSMTKRIECDLEYLRHWSLDLDFKIMLRTALMIWMDRNAY